MFAAPDVHLIIPLWRRVVLCVAFVNSFGEKLNNGGRLVPHLFSFLKRQ